MVIAMLILAAAVLVKLSSAKYRLYAKAAYIIGKLLALAALAVFITEVFGRGV